jgi:hypothetical protein
MTKNGKKWKKLEKSIKIDKYRNFNKLLRYTILENKTLRNLINQ